MFAAWEAGVWKAIAPVVRPDLIVGASAGAWNGWALAGGATPSELAEAWLDPALAAIRLFHYHPLHQRAQDLSVNYRPRVPFGLTVVDLPRLRAELIDGDEVTWQHLAATCSILGCFPPVAIGARRYVDGGLKGALPLWAAARMGATRAVAVNCLQGWLFRGIRRVLPPPLPQTPLEVLAIQPSERLGSLYDAVNWSRSNVERWLALGEKDGQRALDSLQGWNRSIAQSGLQ